MPFTFHYGDEDINVNIPYGRCLGTLDISDAHEVPAVERTVRDALENPIGMNKSIFEIIRPGENVCIIISDSFRKTGSQEFLPPLIKGLNESGITDDAIALLVATGSHRAPNADETKAILGKELFHRFHKQVCVNDAHNSDEHVHVGTTSRGTPVRLDRRAVEADRVIVTGSVVMHYFAGYGGGPKAVFPGIATVDGIAANHAMNLDPDQDVLDPNVAIGKTSGNPIAEDIEEAAAFLKPDCLLNTVLNRYGEIAGVFVGDMQAAHREACEFAREIFALKVDEDADMVIASTGDIKNFVQTHKALFNTYSVVKPHGRIILLAKCPEGLGGEQFQKWLRLGDRAAIIAALRKNAEINGQTALSTIEKAPITLFVTDMSTDDVQMLQGTKAESVEQALMLAKKHFDAHHITEPTYYVMPSAAYTVPFVEAQMSIGA